ncbi:hypothetical protein QBC36DRAFT_35553 [Triangularia setosa]|uniref:DUF6590 domain-containing protein n=1 Tax=Triangularia setosa TaxID=2587417 RepID=A0AAN6W6Z7_9PEZI|nr:hypothetical protein QBC36DRAFT_35553 [Podospora setosa]
MTVATMGQRPPHTLGLELFTLAEDQNGNEDGGMCSALLYLRTRLTYYTVVIDSEAIAICAVDEIKPVVNVIKRTETSPNRIRATGSPTKTESPTAQEIRNASNQATKTETKNEKPTTPKPKDTAGEDTKKPGASADSHREPESENYGDRWEWSSDDSDYIRIDENGVKHLYTDYQKSPDAEAKTPPSPTKSESTAVARKKSTEPKSPAWESPLDSRFQVVTKPKRFFAVGRIFKVPWFEPLGSTDPSSDPFPATPPPNKDWIDLVPRFHGEQPLAKYRWFVVVRRRLHHSLCFSITTYAGANKSAANKMSRGRDVDFVVLHNSNVEPARPYEGENITRKPIAVIIEDQETFISPIARLDCGRVYTVEDHLRVMKVGRVHPGSLAGLEEYFRDSVS